MVLLMLMSVTVALAGNAKDTQTDGEKVRVIIGYVDKPNQADEDMIRGHGGKTKYTYHIIDAKAVEIPKQAIDRIKNNPRVAYVEEDTEMYALGDELPWGVDRIGAELVWNGTDGGTDVTGTCNGTGVKVAIIDTGIQRNHPDLYVVGGINYVAGSPIDGKSNDKWDDKNGHGTHCAGIVAALDNDIGVIGVAPGASLYAVRVLGRNGMGWTSDVIAGIQWSTDNNMDVISMSLGGTYPLASREAACDAAEEAGIVVVAAAGNSGPGEDTVIYPAKYDSVIAVSATTFTNAIASFSSTGPAVELAAPGVNIYSTLPTYRVFLTKSYGYDYGTLSGTSMACPHVAGTAALVIASGITDGNNDGNINDEVRARLQTTADDLGYPGFDNLYGYGLVNASGAVEATA